MTMKTMLLLIASLPVLAHGPDFPPAAVGVFSGGRTSGIEGQFSYGLHLGMATYKFHGSPWQGGARFSAGLGFLPFNLSIVGFSESKSHPDGLGNGYGFRIGCGYNYKKVFYGAYGMRLFGQKAVNNEFGVQLAWIPNFS